MDKSTAKEKSAWDEIISLAEEGERVKCSDTKACLDLLNRNRLAINRLLEIIKEEA